MLAEENLKKKPIYLSLYKIKIHTKWDPLFDTSHNSNKFCRGYIAIYQLSTVSEKNIF